MLDFIGLFINFIWANLQIEIPFRDDISVKLWHLFFFAILAAILVKLIKMNIYNGGNSK